MQNIKDYLAGKSDLETLDVSICAYLCEIAKELWAWPVLPDEILESEYDVVFDFYLMILVEADKNKSKSLLQSIYDVINDSDTMNQLTLEFLSLINTNA